MDRVLSEEPHADELFKLGDDVYNKANVKPKQLNRGKGGLTYNKLENIHYVGANMDECIQPNPENKLQNLGDNSWSLYK